jgi:hypothetical protein
MQLNDACAARSWIWLERLAQDLRYAGMMLIRNPGFSTTAVLTLALSIGMITAMVSVVDAVVLQPLPYGHPERLIWIAGNDPQGSTWPGRTTSFIFCAWWWGTVCRWSFWVSCADWLLLAI